MTADAPARPVTAAESSALSRAAGIPLQHYRDDHVRACVDRAAQRNGCAPAQLAQVLRSSARARTSFRASVLVSITGVFRDPAQFDLLEQTILPPLLRRRDRLDVWSAGCSNGSEAVGIALLLARVAPGLHVRLVGTDLAEEALAAAQRDAGPQIEAAEVDASVRWELRDLAADPAPAGSFDLVVCRNVLIYLRADARTTAERVLAGAVRAGGVLLLGRSEALRQPDDLGLVRCGPNAYRRAP